MKIRSLSVAAFAVTLLFSTHASAVPSAVYDTDTITGVTGLDINGETRDMPLHDGSFGTLLSSDFLSPMRASGFAVDSADALHDFLAVVPGHEDFRECMSLHTCFLWTTSINAEGFTIIVRNIGVSIFNDEPGAVIALDLKPATSTKWDRSVEFTELKIMLLFCTGIFGIIGVTSRKGRM